MMSDNTAGAPKGGLASPKIVKNAKGAFITTPQVAHVMYGCEHIQMLLENARAATIKNYRLILQRIFDREKRIIVQTYVDAEGEPVVTLLATHLCLQCPLIMPISERARHVQTTGHVFSADSHNGYVHCGHCEDNIYDPELERFRLAQGKKPKAEEAASEEDVKLTINNTTFPPCRAIGLRGLYNMGQTCFMSVVLQTLIHNPFIRHFYLAEGHKNDDCEKDGCVSCALDEMFVEFYSQEKTEGYGAVNMLVASWKSGNALAGYNQQDAHEYMQFMLNTLHLQNDGSSEDDCKCVVHTTFHGKLCSTVTCDKCKNTTTAVDPYMDLSLDIKNQSKKRRIDNAAADVALDLRDCLARFTGREKLAAEDYTCHSCNERQNATKQLSIKNLPHVLTIHLKRFEHTKSTSAKISTKISFPMELDLYPYTTSAKSTPSASSSAHKLMYGLSGVIVHIGNIDSGHYVNFAREGPNWFLFDDSKVVLASEADVLAAEAYILFYTVLELD